MGSEKDFPPLQQSSCLVQQSLSSSGDPGAGSCVHVESAVHTAKVTDRDDQFSKVSRVSTGGSSVGSGLARDDHTRVAVCDDNPVITDAICSVVAGSRMPGSGEDDPFAGFRSDTVLLAGMAISTAIDDVGESAVGGVWGGGAGGAGGATGGGAGRVAGEGVGGAGSRQRSGLITESQVLPISHGMGSSVGDGVVGGIPLVSNDGDKADILNQSDGGAGVPVGCLSSGDGPDFFCWALLC